VRCLGRGGQVEDEICGRPGVGDQIDGSSAQTGLGQNSPAATARRQGRWPPGRRRDEDLDGTIPLIRAAIDARRTLVDSYRHQFRPVRAGIPHPAGHDPVIVFRRRPVCQAIKIVHDKHSACAICDEPLLRERNIRRKSLAA
jgi:hypothetical protein